MRGIVIGKFGRGQEFDPIVLLVVEGAPEVLLQDLVDSFRLTI